MSPIRSREVACAQRSSVGHREDALQSLDFSNALFSVHSVSISNLSTAMVKWGGNRSGKPEIAAIALYMYWERSGSTDQLQSLVEAEFVGNRTGLARWVLNMKCSLLSLLRLHSPDCERCNVHETHGDAMRERLEELNWRAQPRSLNHGDHEVMAVFDSEPSEVVASQPTSLKPEQRKTA